jgi:hypothetical protein
MLDQLKFKGGQAVAKAVDLKAKRTGLASGLWYTVLPIIFSFLP